MKKTKVLKADPANPDKKIILLGAKTLKGSGLVAFPTETVYGLAANLFDRKAMDKLRKVKARPVGKPFTVHISRLGTIREMGCPITKEARILADKFWPGPLTMILKSKKGEKIGFRMPDNRIALDLIKAVKFPVVAPSANISGEAPPKSAREALKGLAGKIDILIDGGRTEVGLESTVIDLAVSPPKVLREGAIKSSAISRQLSAKS